MKRNDVEALGAMFDFDGEILDKATNLTTSDLGDSFDYNAFIESHEFDEENQF